MIKIITQCREHKRITSILICCLALWTGKYSRNLVDVELEMPVRYVCRGSRLIGEVQ